MQTTPFRQIFPDLPNQTPGWTPGTGKVKTDDGVLDVYNTAMDEIARKISSSRQPLDLQTNSCGKRQHCIERATQDCKILCDVIAPNNGEQLFEAMASNTLEKNEEADDLVKTLMNAYKNADNRNTRTQFSVCTHISFLSAL